MPELPLGMTRRQFLEAVVLAASTEGLSGCCRHKYFVTDGGLVAPSRAEEISPLTIDIHCHLFNGSDLQLANFMKMTQGYLSGLVSLVQSIDWALAFNGEEEWATLQEVADLTGSPIAGSAATCGQGRMMRNHSTATAPTVTKIEAWQRIDEERKVGCQRAKQGILDEC